MFVSWPFGLVQPLLDTVAAVTAPSVLIELLLLDTTAILHFVDVVTLMCHVVHLGSILVA